MQKTITCLLFLTLLVFQQRLYNAEAVQPPPSGGVQEGQTRSPEQNRIRPQGETDPDIGENHPSYLPPRGTLGLPERNYYIDRAGNYVYYGKPILQGALNINYEIDGMRYTGVNYSVRYFFTERITDDDIFDNLYTGIDGSTYKGQLIHDFRFLLKGTPYPAVRSERVYLPRTFIRLEIKTPEGVKYLIAPSLNAEIIYPIKTEEMQTRAELLIKTYSAFRNSTRDIMLYERIRYSAFAWITLKRSRYETIDNDKIIWHFYQKAILNEQYLSGKLNQLQALLKPANLNLNMARAIEYFKRNNYLPAPENAEYYILRFRYNNRLQHILVPVNKTYHNVLNRPIQELITFFARRFLSAQNRYGILGAREEPQGTWNFEYLD